MRVAGIDCGTNSIRLLIADAEPDDTLVDCVREMRIVRLGAGVDRTGRLDPAAIERTRIALVEYGGLIAAHGGPPIRMVATSATRDAANRADFVAMVRATIGVEPEVITGAAEAALSFAGATQGIGAVALPVLVADIGGGSTELVLGAPPATDLRAHSMDIGCVRLTERRLRSDPPPAEQVSAARADIRAAIEAARVDVPLADAATAIGVAGTVTTMAAIELGLTSYQPAAIHGAMMTAVQIHELTDRLLRMSQVERAALPVMHPGRVDVIAAGALILSELVRATGIESVIASEHDILDAVAASLIK